MIDEAIVVHTGGIGKTPSEAGHGHGIDNPSRRR
jgi:hypothetical protein